MDFGPQTKRPPVLPTYNVYAYIYVYYIHIMIQIVGRYPLDYIFLLRSSPIWPCFYLATHPGGPGAAW